MTVNEVAQVVIPHFKLNKHQKKKKQPNIFDQLKKEYITHSVCKLRRPIDFNWLNILEEDKKRNFDVYKSDNWREVLDEGIMVCFWSS